MSEETIQMLARMNPDMWINVMREFSREIITEQPLLAEILCNEAQKRSDHGRLNDRAADHLWEVLRDCRLKIVPDDETDYWTT